MEVLPHYLAHARFSDVVQVHMNLSHDNQQMKRLIHHKQILESQYVWTTVHNTLPSLPLANPFENDIPPHLTDHSQNTKQNHLDSHLELHVLTSSFIPFIPHPYKLIITFRQIIHLLKYLSETFLDDPGNIL